MSDIGFMIMCLVIGLLVAISVISDLASAGILGISLFFFGIIAFAMMGEGK